MTEFVRSKRVSLSLDMAPLIDVVFQLLIFFMLSSSFLTPMLRLTLPRATTQDTRKTERIVISVDASGEVFVNTQPVPMDQLRGTLERQLAGDAAKAVHVRGDQDMPYRLFIEVMDTARQAGARQINLLHDGARR